MRKANHWLPISICAVSLIFCLAGIAASQTRDRFIISAKAGGINAVSGRATMHGRGVTEWQQLTIKEDLESGDVVKTGADGRVEMLLNPGSYLRVGENSEFELANNSLDNLEVRLLRGTAIVEATGTDDMELLINITTPDARLAIVRRGLYRVNVVPGDSTELIVRKGRVMLGGDSHTKIKGGNKVIFTSGSMSIAKLQKAEKKQTDDLDTWSKDRGQTMARANQKIQRRDIRSAVFAMRDPFFRGSGVWVFNGAFGCFTFLPFHLGWGSPYGSSYSSALYMNPRYWRDGVYYGYPTVGNGGSGGGYGTGAGAGAGGGGGTGGGSGSYNPPPRPISPPREVPTALERKVERLNDRMPQP